MTNHPSPQDGEQKPETPATPDFSKFNVQDSFSIPAKDTTMPGEAPDEHRRISRQQLAAIDIALSARDRQVLLAVQKYRYLLTGQVQRLYFLEAATPAAALRATSRNLKKLKELGLVDSLSRRIGGVRAGSSGLIWYLTHAGERLLRLRDHKPYPSKRFFEPSPHFLAHGLAVAEISIRLTEICREHASGLSVLELEPECWRTYSDYGAMLSLKPDLFAVTVSDQYEDRWFFEVDLATESPAKVIEKCDRYHKYYRSGLEQEKSEVFPLTVWVVPDSTRKERLIAHIREAFDKQPKLFAVITTEELEDLIRYGGTREILC